MACSTLIPFLKTPSFFSLFPHHHRLPVTITTIPSKPINRMTQFTTSSIGSSTDLMGPISGALGFLGSNPATWESAVCSNAVIFVLGSPILVSGLSLNGIVAAFLLGTLTWRAFGASGFLLVATYFVVGTAATKVKMAQKEAQGVAEKRKGRRGPGSVIGSSAAGCVCAILSINGVGGKALSHLWQLGYLVTTFKIVPRGTEGAVSIEGTVAGLVASVLLAFVGCLIGQINATEAVLCVIASQLANLGESVIGASLQDKDGFRWLNNDAVNVINITMGSILAVILQQILLHSLRR
ncbi:VTE6, chloroplastic-like protein [Drosera capensis]